MCGVYNMYQTYTELIMLKPTIENIIYDTIYELLSETNSKIDKLNPTHNLNADLGFTSLELARLIALLDHRLRDEPFAKTFSISSLKTISDLIKIYLKSHKINTILQKEELTRFKQRVAKRRNLQFERDSLA